MAKRIFDFFVSLIGLIVFFPFFLIIGLLIKLDSRGPVFYRGIRVGKGGKEFKIYKFRSMVYNAEKVGGPSTAGDDARVTKIGQFIRRYKLDEFSQLINVLKGEMSLVGHRPEVPAYVNMLSDEEREIIFSVRPGITDWASLWNMHEEEILKGSTDPEKTYLEKIRPEKTRLQIKYVKERNFFKDIEIILQTISRIFK